MKSKPKFTNGAIEEVKLKDLIPDKRNYNKGTQFGDHLLEKSLTKFGCGRSALLDKNGQFIGGNKVSGKAGEIGIEDVIIVHSDGTKLIAVQRDDIDLDSKEGRELALLDNKTSEVNLDWDMVLLHEDFEEQELIDVRFQSEIEDNNIKSELVEKPLIPYSKTHILLSFPPALFQTVKTAIDSILNNKEIEYEQCSN